MIHLFQTGFRDLYKNCELSLKVYRLKIELRFQNPHQEEVILPLEASPDSRRPVIGPRRCRCARWPGRSNSPEMPTLYTDLFRFMRWSPISCPFNEGVTLEAKNSPESLLRRLSAMAVLLFSTGSSVRRRRNARRSTWNRSRPLSIRTVENGEISPAIEETKLLKEKRLTTCSRNKNS
ncbi:hypothetical protein JCGZ_17063 [Jatropha curcas]|uniref:Uncharacterized protein n=1 Tax=Jatropha curcas TaxID=180498 RepID=A0A067LL87_JATCU|nr:hypothetical protein JCGZ_17063 [Jatropha curcas]